MGARTSACSEPPLSATWCLPAAMSCQACAMGNDATTPQPFNPSLCAACRVIDASDGSEDGVLFASSIGGVRNEHWLWNTLRRAEDRTADRITIFAGSMRFVYI